MVDISQLLDDVMNSIIDQYQIYQNYDKNSDDVEYIILSRDIALKIKEDLVDVYNRHCETSFIGLDYTSVKKINKIIDDIRDNKHTKDIFVDVVFQN
jgi:low affinity Fe/Cu permease